MRVVSVGVGRRMVALTTCFETVGYSAAGVELLFPLVALYFVGGVSASR